MLVKRLVNNYDRIYNYRISQLFPYVTFQLQFEFTHNYTLITAHFYERRSFITMFKKSPLLEPINLSKVLRSRPQSQRLSLSFRFSDVKFHSYVLFLYACYMSSPLQPSWVAYVNSIWRRIQIRSALDIHFLASSCYFFSCRSKIFYSISCSHTLSIWRPRVVSYMYTE
jgi:hypothetical protein